MASGDPALHKLCDAAAELVGLGELDGEEALLLLTDVKPGMRRAAVAASTRIPFRWVPIWPS